jgi:hypothetical protein
MGDPLDRDARRLELLHQPPGNVIVLSDAAWRRSPRSVNRALGAVHGFYEYHARNGVEVAERLVSRSRSGVRQL